MLLKQTGLHSNAKRQRSDPKALMGRWAKMSLTADEPGQQAGSMNVTYHDLNNELITAGLIVKALGISNRNSLPSQFRCSKTQWPWAERGTRSQLRKGGNSHTLHPHQPLGQPRSAHPPTGQNQIRLKCEPSHT